MLNTAKKKAFCIVSILSYILSMILANFTFGGVRIETGNIKVDGMFPFIAATILSAVMFAMWILSIVDASKLENMFIISFSVSLVGIVGSGLSYWRFILLNKACEVMRYHASPSSGWDYLLSETRKFKSLASKFEDDASVFLALAVVLWILTVVAIFITINGVSSYLVRKNSDEKNNNVKDSANTNINADSIATEFVKKADITPVNDASEIIFGNTKDADKEKTNDIIKIDTVVENAVEKESSVTNTNSREKTQTKPTVKKYSLKVKSK